MVLPNDEEELNKEDNLKIEGTLDNDKKLKKELLQNVNDNTFDDNNKQNLVTNNTLEVTG